jgi:hypothetical protein
VPGQGLIYGDGKLGRVGPPMDQASRCELCHIGHVIVIEMTAPAHCQHGADPFQKRRSLFLRDIGGKRQAATSPACGS